MFLPCPQCGFLVALIAPRGNAAQRCPRCGFPLPRPDEAIDALQPASTGAPTEREAGPDGPPADDLPAPAATDDRAASAPVGLSPDAPVATDAARPHPARLRSSMPADGDAPSPSPLAVEPQRPVQAPPPTLVEPHPPLAVALHDAAAPPAASTGRRSPSFARRARVGARHARRRWPLYLGIAALAAALALQLLLAQRRELAADARWRPWIESTCRVLRCAVPAWHQPSAFTMLDRSVRPRAGASGVLAVRARFRNDARWPQAWPVVVLSLSDVDGRVLGTRAFEPGEYAPSTRAATLAPGEAATMTLDVVEPAPGVVAFGFDFR